MQDPLIVDIMTKKILIGAIVFALVSTLWSCDSISYIPIETLNPGKVVLPDLSPRIALIHVENDFDKDKVIDTALSELIMNELYVGVTDLVYISSVDTGDVVFYKHPFKRSELFQQGSIDWDKMNEIAGKYYLDYIAIIDTITIRMSSDMDIFYDYDIPVYYNMREFKVNTEWLLVDPAKEKVLDDFFYKDSFYWEKQGFNSREVKNGLPSVVQSVKETGYWMGYDYAKRIFPTWSGSYRSFYSTGKSDFKKAADLFINNKIKEAVVLWKKYVNSPEKELAARARYNIAVASELKGNLDLALFWANKSYEVLDKDRTERYIRILKRRVADNKKLLKQQQ